MPEEKKKESFTFSDKIKNSKPAPSKSFAHRASSKIGSNGKPRQTLFERTKRDAPFFIAALVALLLLPFLYKYSGTVEEQTAVLPPDYEDSPFNPDLRSGFDGFSGNPDEQIVQLAGRDPLDRIRPYRSGSGETEVEDEGDFTPSSSESSSSDSASHRLDEQDEEENITNIYRYPRSKSAAVRAGFQRAPTKIGRLGNAGRAGASGEKLGIGMWGGSLKRAANRVRDNAPKSAPKPVSLQPLQAAGKPSRTYFGQGPAREAARSKDAMSKSNAMQALMDAQMKPVEPTRVGGVFAGDMGGPGGGNGELKREFAFNGKEPWWWDMMKQRSMMEWQKNLEYQWAWKNWRAQLARDIMGNIITGVANCVITGDEDGKPGKIFGAVEGAGKKAKCCGLEEDLFRAKYKDASSAFPTDFEKACKAIRKGDAGKKECPSGWQDPHTASANMGFLGSRIDCLSNGLWASLKGKKGDGSIDEVNQCTTFYQTGYYQADVNAKKRVLYHYVVGIPYNKVEDFFKSNNPDKRKEMLQIGYFAQGPSFVVDSTEASQQMNERKFVPLFIESVAIKSSKLTKKIGYKTEHKASPDTIQTVDNPEGEVSDKTAKFVEKVLRMFGLGSRPSDKHDLKYVDFLDELRDGGIVINEEGTTLLSAKGGKKGKGWQIGARCAYPMAFVSCRNHALYNKNGFAAENSGIQQGVVDGTPVAFIKLPNMTYPENTKTNGSWNDGKLLNKLAEHFTVMYEIQGTNQVPASGISTSLSTANNTLYFANIHSSSKGYDNDDQTIRDDVGMDFKANKETYNVKVEGEKALKQLEALTKENDKRAVITWTVRQDYNAAEPWAIGGAIANGQGYSGSKVAENATTGSGVRATQQIVSSATCVYFDEGGVSLQVEDEKSQKEITPPTLKGKKPHQQESQQQHTCLAKELSWVPENSTEREVQTGDCTQELFRGKKLIPGQDEQHCASDMGIEPIKTSTATEFVRKVVAAYNNEHKDNPIEFTGEYPTMGEFVDALQIAKQLGIEVDNAPKDGVCLMARHVVRRSRDPHSTKYNTTFYNELGAYLAYVHQDAAYYPNKYYGSRGNCDKRFLKIRTGECTANPYILGRREYHHTNYGYGGHLDSYLNSLEKLGIFKKGEREYPLRALVDDNLMQLSTHCKDACYDQRNLYRQTFSHLLQGKCPTGNMKVADALAYITGVCEVGLNTKPYGSPGNSNGPSAVTGSGREDTPVEQQ